MPEMYFFVRVQFKSRDFMVRLLQKGPNNKVKDTKSCLERSGLPWCIPLDFLSRDWVGLKLVPPYEYS